jgi:hypothetical protein
MTDCTPTVSALAIVGALTFVVLGMGCTLLVLATWAEKRRAHKPAQTLPQAVRRIPSETQPLFGPPDVKLRDFDEWLKFVDRTW